MASHKYPRDYCFVKVLKTLLEIPKTLSELHFLDFKAGKQTISNFNKCRQSLCYPFLCTKQNNCSFKHYIMNCCTNRCALLFLWFAVRFEVELQWSRDTCFQYAQRVYLSLHMFPFRHYRGSLRCLCTFWSTPGMFYVKIVFPALFKFTLNRNIYSAFQSAWILLSVLHDTFTSQIVVLKE